MHLASAGSSRQLAQPAHGPFGGLIVGGDEREWRAASSGGHLSLTPDVVLANLQVVARGVQQAQPGGVETFP